MLGHKYRGKTETKLDNKALNRIYGRGKGCLRVKKGLSIVI